MSLRPRQNNSQRYPPETQQEVPHAVQISRLGLPRLQANESLPNFALVPLIFGVRQEKHKSASRPSAVLTSTRGVFKKQPWLWGHGKTIHISHGVRKISPQAACAVGLQMSRLQACKENLTERLVWSGIHGLSDVHHRRNARGRMRGLVSRSQLSPTCPKLRYRYI